MPLLRTRPEGVASSVALVCLLPVLAACSDPPASEWSGASVPATGPESMPGATTTATESNGSQTSSLPPATPPGSSTPSGGETTTPSSNSPPGDSSQGPPPVSPDPTQPGAGGRAPSDGGAGGGAGGTEGPGEPAQGGGPTEGGAGGQSEGGAPSDGGASSNGSGGMVADMGFDRPVMKGSGTSSEQYETALVSRNDVPFVLITNGWGPGFDSHTISWSGTSFIVEAMSGGPGPSGQPASYPTVFCGRYSVREVAECGLPRELSALTSLKTGWRWTSNGNNGAYNAAYDIWVGTGTRLEGYLMVWLRDPPGYQPAGSPNMAHQGVEVANVPGTWNVWNGTVNGLPIINWVRAEGEDSTEIEFDVLDFIRDAAQRGLSHPGTHINAVAVGFEIWEGPISNLESVDFYVEVE